MNAQSENSLEWAERAVEEACFLIQGSGEMADRIRAHAWGDTHVGAIHDWPPELLALVNLMLASREIATIFWGQDRMMIYNDAYAAQLGDRHPMLGRTLREVWPEVIDQIAPLIDPVFRDGVTSYLDNAPLTVMEDGEETERFYTACYEPIWIRDRDRVRVKGVFHTATDNTAKIVLQRRLQLAEAEAREAQRMAEQTATKLALALEAAGLASWYYDLELGTVGGDQKMAELFGLPEPVGRVEVWMSKVHPEDLDRVRAEFISALEGQPYSIVHRILCHGEVKWIRAKARMADDDGRLRLIGLCEDITHLKNTEAALVRNEKLAAVGRLASSISHEINNPLESVTNLLYLISGSSDVETIREYTETAERELRRVSLIVNQTVRFHRQSTYASQFYCQDLIGESLSLFQGRLINAGIEVEKRKRAQQAVTCLGGEIRQVLGHLIGNAIDAMPLGGRLILRSREATHWKTGARGIVLTVADTGIGMSRATQGKIFEAFFSTKGIGGTGLGLWISCEIVARHHGALRVRSSQATGHTGSVFTIFLPFAAD